jgi:glyoxylase-like metal-dependent hydrolase (beta-lactamase superfamily II)
MLEEVRLLSAGSCLHPEAMTRRGAPWRPQRFPAGFALIHHRRHGAVLFDTGYSRHFFHETRALPNRLYAWLTPASLEDSQTACAQLAASGIAPQDVRSIVVSHFHADHFAGLRDFPASQIICSAAAWHSVRHARGLSALAKGFLPGLLPPDIEQRLVFVDTMPLVPLEAPLASFGLGYDLFGDGSALAVDLPGHATGQIGLFLPGLSPDPLLLVADAAFSHHAIQAGTPPPRVTTSLLGHTQDYRATLARLRNLRREAPSVRIVPSHGEIVWLA